jgi:hypothetical protein
MKHEYSGLDSSALARIGISLFRTRHADQVMPFFTIEKKPLLCEGNAGDIWKGL